MSSIALLHRALIPFDEVLWSRLETPTCATHDAGTGGEARATAGTRVLAVGERIIPSLVEPASEKTSDGLARIDLLR